MFQEKIAIINYALEKLLTIFFHRFYQPSRQTYFTFIHIV